MFCAPILAFLPDGIFADHNSHCKRFNGTPPLYYLRTAMTVYLLLAILKGRYRLEQRLSQILRYLRITLRATATGQGFAGTNYFDRAAAK